MINGETIDRLKEGNREAFSLVVDTCTEQMLVTATRITACREDAEDILQDCFIKVWEKRKTIKSSESFIPWLRKIVVNRCFDHLRQKQRKGMVGAGEAALELSISAGDLTADHKISEEEMIRILEFVVSGLSPKQRLIFILSEIEELTNREIAGITGIPPYNIKSNLFHARKRVRQIFNQMEESNNG